MKNCNYTVNATRKSSLIYFLYFIFLFNKLLKNNHKYKITLFYKCFIKIFTEFFLIINKIRAFLERIIS
jgi:hypothetical protein